MTNYLSAFKLRHKVNRYVHFDNSTNALVKTNGTYGKKCGTNKCPKHLDTPQCDKSHNSHWLKNQQDQTLSELVRFSPAASEHNYWHHWKLHSIWLGLSLVSTLSHAVLPGSLSDLLMLLLSHEQCSTTWTIPVNKCKGPDFPLSNFIV